MKVSFVAVALTLAAGVAAQSLADLPDCAFSCLAGGLQKTGCGTEIGCACKKEDFVSGAVTCVKGKCNEADTAIAVKVALGICKAAGVDVTLPGAAPTSTVAPTTTAVPTTTVVPTTTAAPETTTTAPEKTTTTAAPAPISTGGPPANNGTNGTTPITPPVNDDSAAGKIAVSGLLAAGLGLAVAFGL